MKEQEKVELKSIFKELKDGNKEKLEELYNKYKKTVYSIAFGILKNKEDAEDLTNSVFLAIFEYFSKNIEIQKIENLI